MVPDVAIATLQYGVWVHIKLIAVSQIACPINFNNISIYIVHPTLKLLAVNEMLYLCNSHNLIPVIGELDPVAP